MLKVSCFTPTHNPKYLTDLWESIKDQPFDEWVILAQGCKPKFKDKRVKVYSYPKLGDHYVGALKREACRLCTGDILLEIDHDDVLVDGAIKEIQKAFRDPEIGFVYSNFSNFKDDFQKYEHYDENYGWKYRPFNYKGHELEEYVSFKPSAASIGKI